MKTDAQERNLDLHGHNQLLPWQVGFLRKPNSQVHIRQKVKLDLLACGLFSAALTHSALFKLIGSVRAEIQALSAWF